MSSLALHNTMQINDLKSGDDGTSTMTKISTLYGTHGCEDGGFSIQIGMDINDDGTLDAEEVSEIKNVCHGEQGESGSMGNRGYSGFNGTNGSNGIDGVDGLIGNSPFIQSYSGAYGACPDAVVIEMGNNSTSQQIESSIKICFEDLVSGRLTDIQENTGNSFSTACEGGVVSGEFLIFSAVQADKCLLYSLQNGVLNQISPTVDFAPGSILGFIEHQDRVWFDATDSSGTQLWSSDGINTWKESNLSSNILNGNSITKNGAELVLTYTDGLAIFGESESFISGVYSNTTSSNGILLYNTPTGISIAGNIASGEINSQAAYHFGSHWFIATTDASGPQLHSWDGINLVKMSSNLQSDSGQTIPPTVIGNSIVFDSGGLVAFNTLTSTLIELNSSLQSVGQSTHILHQGELWFDCGHPSTGYELCVSDGESAWVHSDHVPGMTSSSPSNLATLESSLLVTASHPTEGGQLYLVEENELTLLWDHDVGGLDSATHGELWIGQDMVYFIGDSSTTGLEIYGWAHGQLSDEWIIIH